MNVQNREIYKGKKQISSDLGLGLDVNEKSDFFFGGDKNVLIV